MARLWLERRIFECAWIDGNPKAGDIARLTCCGAAVVESSSYCAEHRKRTKGKALGKRFVILDFHRPQVAA